MIIHSPIVTGSLQISGSFLPQQAVTASYISLQNVDGSASLASRISAQERFSSSLDATYAKDSELATVSSSLAGRISSISTDFSDIENKPTLISSSNQIASDISGSFTALSASMATRMATNTGAIAGNLITISNASSSLAARSANIEQDLALKAPLASPSFTGNPTAPTQTGTDSSTKVATTAFVQDRIDSIIGTAGSALDTLGELSASLASDADALSALTNTVGGKLTKSSNLSDLTDVSAARTNLGLGTAATTNSTAYATAAQGTKADSALQSSNNLSDLGNAATARTNLGVDAAGTDNSTNVTLAGAYDYLTISGQTITRNQIDWNTDVTNKPSIPAPPTNVLITLEAGSGLSGGGNFTTNQYSIETITFSHADTSIQGTVTNSGNTVIQGITLDTYGHVTGLSSKALSIPSAANNATITISAGSGLSGGAAFTTNQGANETITLSHGNTSNLSGTYGSTNNRQKINTITVDSNGHVTAVATGDIGYSDRLIGNNVSLYSTDSGDFFYYGNGNTVAKISVYPVFPAMTPGIRHSLGLYGEYMKVEATTGGNVNYTVLGGFLDIDSRYGNTQVNVYSDFNVYGYKNFRIDHPVSPETHDLVHTVLESDKADVVYRGKAELQSGSAAINLDQHIGLMPGTFEALTRNVQVFTTNEDGWTATKGSVSGSLLSILAQDPSCTDQISWLVFGERNDEAALNSSIVDESGKIILEPQVEGKWKDRREEENRKSRERLENQ